MFISLLSIGCTKEKTPVVAEVKEYFAPKDADVKQEIYDFLSAANRIPNIANKTTTNPLTDKEPNEGAWIMEAAINVERYGRLDKDVVDTKTYIIDVENKILPDGLIRMDAADIIAKYSQLISAIVSDEINQKVASLIDFQILEIKPEYTRIKVKVSFYQNNININLLNYGTASNEPCSYEEINNLVFDYNTLPVIQLELPVNLPQITDPYAYSGQLSTFGPNIYNLTTYQVNLSWYYKKSAENNGFYNYLQTPIPTNGNNIINPFDPNLGIVDWIPYTNVTMFNALEIETIAGCAFFDKIGDYYPENSLAHSKSLNKLKHLNEFVENTLPNSQTIEYALVNNIIYSGYSSIWNYWLMESWHLSFVIYQSN